MDVLLFAKIAVLSFVLSLMLIYLYIRVGGIRIWRDDCNKPRRRKVLTGGGLPVLIVDMIFYISFIFILPGNEFLFIGISATTLIAMGFGLIDEFMDIRVWKKVPLMIVPVIPMVVISLFHPLWGHTSVLWFDFGILYWIFVVPVVYMGFSNGANIIAGYDGLEGGVYILISLLYVVVGLLLGNEVVVLLSLVLLSTIVAFEIFNVPPSRLLMGNVGSFPIGGLLGIIPLIGHFEIVLPIVFLPHLIEFFFKVKHRGHTSVFGEVDEHGILHNKEEVKSIIHWLISWGNMTEKKITLAMLGIEAVLCAVAFGVWYFVWFL